MCLNCGPTYGCEPSCTQMKAAEAQGTKFVPWGEHGLKVAMPAVPVSSVDHPQHYGGEEDPYEVIKVAEAWGFDSNAYLFNVLKYIRRQKGHTLEDLKKARWYLDRLISRLENTEKRPLGIRQDGSNDV